MLLKLFLNIMRDGDTLHDFPRHCQTKWGVWKQRVKGPRCSRRLAKRSVNKHLPKKKKPLWLWNCNFHSSLGLCPHTSEFRQGICIILMTGHSFFLSSDNEENNASDSDNDNHDDSSELCRKCEGQHCCGTWLFCVFFFVIFLSFSWLILSG